MWGRREVAARGIDLLHRHMQHAGRIDNVGQELRNDPDILGHEAEKVKYENSSCLRHSAIGRSPSVQETGAVF